MAKNTLFEFFLLQGRVPRPGQPNPRLRISYVSESDSFVVEESNDGVSYLTRTAANQITPAYPITAGVVSSYRFCQATTLVEFVSSLTFPYATKQQTPNSSFCQINTDPDDVLLKVIVSDETEPDAEDGKITSVATSLSTVTHRLYRGWVSSPLPPEALIATNTTGVFTNLLPGQYTVDVTNARGKVARQLVTVAEFSFAQYGLFARMQFDSNYLSKSYRLDIRKKNYAGVVRNACGDGSAPVRRSYKGTTGPGLYSYIYGQSLDFTLIADSLRDWTILYTQDDREYLIEYYLDTEGVSELLFRGYLLPEFVSQAYYDGNHVANFTASDGLGQLKEYPYLRSNGERFSGVKSLQQILEDCLIKVNLDIELFHTIKWSYEFDTSTPNPVLNVLTTVGVDVNLFYEQFENPTCENVIHAICIAFEGSLAQVSGRFLFNTPYSYYDTPGLVALGKSGSLTLERLSRSGSKEQLLAGLVDNVLVVLETGIEVNPGVESIQKTEKLFPVAGLIPNPNLEETGDFIYNASTGHLDVAGWIKQGTIPIVPFFNYAVPSRSASSGAQGAAQGSRDLRTDWGGGASSSQAQTVADGMVFVNIRDRVDQVKFIAADCGLINREAFVVQPNAAELSFQVYFKVHCKLVGAPVRFRIQIRWGDYDTTFFYLKKDNSGWQQGIDYLEYTFADGDFDKDVEFSFITPVLPSVGAVGLNQSATVRSGNLLLSISEPYLVNPSDSPVLSRVNEQFGFSGRNTPLTSRVDKRLAIKQVQVKPLLSGAELINQYLRVHKNSGDFTTLSVVEEQILGSHYYGQNNRLFYPFALRRIDTVPNPERAEPLTFWVDPTSGAASAQTDVYRFGELSHRVLIRARQIQREQIQATLRGDFKFFQKLLLLQDNNLAYFCQEATYDDVNDTVSGTFVYAEGSYPRGQIRLNEDGTVKLLENGTIEIRSFEKSYQYDEDLTTI